MKNSRAFLAGLVLLLTAELPAAAQRLNDDGFQRHNGQMHVLRNGQLRPMTRDARLPTGALVTKDGFVVAANGQRTELREGQGCNLKGQLVAVKPDAAGRLALAPPAAAPRPAPAPVPARSVLDQLFGSSSEYRGRGRGHGKKWKKKKHKKDD